MSKIVETREGQLMLKKATIWLLVIIVLVAVTSVAVASAKAQGKDGAVPVAADSSQFIGSDQCLACHEAAGKSIDKGPHWKAKTAHAQSCEACHGPGKAHMEGGGDKSKIISFKTMKPNEVTLQCLKCHENNQDHQAFESSLHNRAGVTCTSCHSIHAAKVTEKLLVQKDPGLCYSCHGTVQSAFMKPFHHRVNEGLVKCSDCHNLHGGNTEHQLRSTGAQDAVCFKCHTEKRGPFVFEHAPVKTEGCTACHTPHGSSNARLLTRARVNSLCLTCHSALATGMSSGNHYQNAARQSCVGCHSQIHGSNASNKFFK
jgi:DmsE family decaheme c-type cytochrome